MLLLVLLVEKLFFTVGKIVFFSLEKGFLQFYVKFDVKLKFQSPRSWKKKFQNAFWRAVAAGCVLTISPADCMYSRLGVDMCTRVDLLIKDPRPSFGSEEKHRNLSCFKMLL